MALGRTTAAAVRPATISERRAALPEVMVGGAIGWLVMWVGESISPMSHLSFGGTLQ